MATPLSDKVFEDLVDQVMGVRLEKDRVKLIKTAVAQTTLSLEQGKKFLDTVRFGDAKVDMAAALYPHMASDADKLLAALPYEEDRVAVRQKLKL